MILARTSVRILPTLTPKRQYLKLFLPALQGLNIIAMKNNNIIELKIRDKETKMKLKEKKKEKERKKYNIII